MKCLLSTDSVIAPAVWLRLDCSASWIAERGKSAGESEPDTFLPCRMLNNAQPNPQNNPPWALDPTAPSCAKREWAGRTRLAFREVAAAPQMPRVHPTARVRLFIWDLLDIAATGFKTRLPRRLFSWWLIRDVDRQRRLIPLLLELNVAEALNGLTGLECITVRKQGARRLHLACWVLMTPPHWCSEGNGMSISQSCCQEHK